MVRIRKWHTPIGSLNKHAGLRCKKESRHLFSFEQRALCMRNLKNERFEP